MSFVPVIIEWMSFPEGKLEECFWRRIGGSILARGRNICRSTPIIAHDGWVPDYLRGGSWPIQVDPSAEISVEQQSRSGHLTGRSVEIEGNVLVEDILILFPGSFVPAIPLS